MIITSRLNITSFLKISVSSFENSSPINSDVSIDYTRIYTRIIPRATTVIIERLACTYTYTHSREHIHKSVQKRKRAKNIPSETYSSRSRRAIESRACAYKGTIASAPRICALLSSYYRGKLRGWHGA